MFSWQSTRSAASIHHIFQGRTQHRIIQTLDANALTPSHFHDLSGRQTVQFTVGDPALRIRFRIRYVIVNGESLSFPAQTRGFLYYSPPLNQIRFRITGSSDPKSFQEGKDLSLPDGSPWYTVPRPPGGQSTDYRQQNTLSDVLQYMGLLPVDRDSAILQVKQRAAFPPLTRFGEPFKINLGALAFYLTSRNLGSRTNHRTRHENPLNIYNPGGPYERLFSGKYPLLLIPLSISAFISDRFI